MKIFQILNGFCYWDATSIHATLESTNGRYSPEIHFVEAPDYVFESWGFDETAEGDARFIKPIPPEGWLYDDVTGTFYPEHETPPSERPTYDELLEAYTILTGGETNA